MLPLLDNNTFTGLHTKPTNAFLEALSTFLNLATGSDTLEIKQKAAFFFKSSKWAKWDWWETETSKTAGLQQQCSLATRFFRALATRQVSTPTSQEMKPSIVSCLQVGQNDSLSLPCAITWTQYGGTHYITLQVNRAMELICVQLFLFTCESYRNSNICYYSQFR